MMDLERELRELLLDKAEAGRATGPAPAPVLRRVRRRQVVTVLTAAVMVIALGVGSFAGLRALFPGGRAAPAAGGERTSTVHGVTITYPDDWTLAQLGDRLGQDEVDVMPVLQLSNFDPGTFVCPLPSGEVPEGGVLLYVQQLSGPRDLATPPVWPVEPGPSSHEYGLGCVDAQSYATWSAHGRTYEAFLGGAPLYGDIEGTADYERLLKSFRSLAFAAGAPEPAPFQVGDTTFTGSAYVLQSGEVEGEPWNLLALTFRTDTARYLCTVLDKPGRDHTQVCNTPDVAEEDVSVSAGRLHENMFLFGTAPAETARILIGDTSWATVPLPSGLGVSADAFALDMGPFLALGGTLVAVDSEGRELFRKDFDLRAVAEALPVGDPGADRVAQSDLRNTLAAALTYFTDGDTFVGFDPEQALLIEPSLEYDTSPLASVGIVSIRDVAVDHVLLVTRSESGHVFCVADDRTASGGTTYGTIDAQTVDECDERPDAWDLS